MLSAALTLTMLDRFFLIRGSLSGQSDLNWIASTTAVLLGRPHYPAELVADPGRPLVLSK